MNRLVRKCRKFITLQNREKLWVALLFLLSGIARAVILILPFRRIAPYLGQHYQNAQLAAVVTEKQLHTASQIGLVTELTAKHTPWQSKCLVQAMMARCLLGYYGIPYVLYLGVAKSTAWHDARDIEDNALIAHAWLSVGPSIITGNDGHTAFTIVSTFVAPSIINSSSMNRQDTHAI